MLHRWQKVDDEVKEEEAGSAASLRPPPGRFRRLRCRVADVKIDRDFDIIARRVVVLVCSAFDPATSPSDRKAASADEEDPFNSIIIFCSFSKLALMFTPPPPELLATASAAAKADPT